MKCPFCATSEDKVIDSREASDGLAVRRRRECTKCQRRYTTYERLEESLLLVVKRDGRRESFDRKKLLGGVRKACEKRPIPLERLEALVEELEREVGQEFDKEISSVQIGERVMQRLQQLDDVAYVRFASVYRSFKDLNEFMKELRDTLERDRKGNGRIKIKEGGLN